MDQITSDACYSNGHITPVRFDGWVRDTITLLYLTTHSKHDEAKAHLSGSSPLHAAARLQCNCDLSTTPTTAARTVFVSATN